MRVVCIDVLDGEPEPAFAFVSLLPLANPYATLNLDVAYFNACDFLPTKGDEFDLSYRLERSGHLTITGIANVGRNWRGEE
jgi:hypothetical protein